MKKRLLSLIALFSIGTASAGAQNCTIDNSYTEPGIYPPADPGLPHAYVDSAYGTDIQIKMPTDTTVDYPGLGIIDLTINYFKVDSVVGLPPNFLFNCNPGNNTFNGGSNGCIHLFGPAPAIQDTGTYPLIVYVTANLNHFALGDFDYPQTIETYSIVVEGPLAVQSFDLNTFQLGQNIPNPFGGETTIQFSHPSVTEMEFVVYDMLGKVIYTNKFMSKVGMNHYNFNSLGLNQGVYMYTLSDGSRSYTKRMVISSK